MAEFFRDVCAEPHLAPEPNEHAIGAPTLMQCRTARVLYVILLTKRVCFRYDQKHLTTVDGASPSQSTERMVAQMMRTKGPMSSANSFTNTLLRQMDGATVARLHLQRVELPLLHHLEDPGEPIAHIFFLEEGIASMTTCFANGAQVETSMFGYESVIGISTLMGTKHSLNAIFMQSPGYGYASPVEAAREEFRRNGIFQVLALRYVQIQLTLSTQNAACNAMHTYEQRLARWLLICSDRAKQNQLQMSQDFVAMMLGSTRSTVSLAASTLKSKRLIDYSRGMIIIRDIKGLEAESCECYRVIRRHLESMSDFDQESLI